MSKIKKIFSSVTDNAYVFSVIAKIISVGTGLLYSVLYSRYMQPELRGTAGVISNNAELIMLVLCFGVYQGYPYFKKKTGQDIYNDYINLISGMFLVYCLTGGLIILVMRPEPGTIMTIALIPFMFATKQFNYAVLIEHPKLRNSAQIWIDIFDIVLVVGLMIFTESSFNICMIFLMAKEVVYFSVAVANLKVNVFKIRPSLKGLLPYVKFGIVPMITVIMMEINYKADVLMLKGFGVDEAQIGIYTLGVSLVQKVWLIPDALKDILLSNLAKGKNEEEVCKITRLSLFIMMFFVVGLIALGKPVVNWMYGDSYDGTFTIMLILIVGVVGMVFYKMIYSYNVINGHKNVNLLLLGIAALTNVAVNALVIPDMGINGAGLASTISYVVCGIAFLVYFCVKTGTKFRDMLFVKKSDLAQLKKIFKK